MARWWVSDKSTGTRIFLNTGLLTFFVVTVCHTGAPSAGTKARAVPKNSCSCRRDALMIRHFRVVRHRRYWDTLSQRETNFLITWQAESTGVSMSRTCDTFTMTIVKACPTQRSNARIDKTLSGAADRCQGYSPDKSNCAMQWAGAIGVDSASSLYHTRLQTVWAAKGHRFRVYARQETPIIRDVSAPGLGHDDRGRP